MPASGTGTKTAFVLAGGGTKGAFEAGAIRYMVEERGIVPDVVAAASAGAVAGAVIAQARSLDEFAQRAKELEEDLLAMTHTSLLFGTQPWVQAVQGTPIGSALNRYLLEATRPPPPGEEPPNEWGGSVRFPRARQTVRLARAALHVLVVLGRLRRAIKGGTGSILTLDPLADALRKGGPSGIKPIDPSLVARPGLQLRLAVIGLQSGRLRYVTESGMIVESDAVTPVRGTGAGPVDLIEAVLASSSVPLVFPPRPMADDVYVDGGLLQNIPVEAAVQLGARRIMAVLAVPLEQPPDRRDFSKANAADIFLRTMGAIAFADRQQANLAHPLPGGTVLTVIDPTIDVVGPFEVAPGLMLLDMDYGWLRAADVLTEAEEVARRAAMSATDALVVARIRAWNLEEELWARRKVEPKDVARLVDVKLAVREALRTREKLGFPGIPGDECWWNGYEAHAGPPPDGLPPPPLRLRF